VSPLLSDAFALAERLGGAPVNLYTFARGSVMWRYTSDGLALTVPATGLSYTAATIHHDEIQRKDESGAVDIKLTLGSRLAIVDALRDGSTEPMVCAIHRYHPSAGGTPARFAYGAVGSLSLDSTTGQSECVLRTSESQFDLDVPKALITVQCALSTYSAQCGVKSADFSLDAQIVDVSHRTIEVDSVGTKPDGYYDFGIAKIGRELVYIERQVGTVLTIFSDLPLSFTVGATVSLLAGDDKSASTCRAKFDNLSRFLGFPWLPARNPLLVRDGAPSPARTTWDEPYGDPVSYVTPAKWQWHDGDHVVLDLGGHVSIWNDRSGNGRDIYAPAPVYGMDYEPPDGVPPADGHDTGRLLFGARDGIAPAPTMLYVPSMGALTQAEIFFTFRIGYGEAAVVSDIAIPPIDQDIYLWNFAGQGYGTGTTLFPRASDGHIIDATGLVFPFVYDVGRPNTNIMVDMVYNVTVGPDRWTARLNGNVLFTRAMSYDGHANGFSLGPMNIGNGNAASTLLAAARRFLVYPAVLSPADRAAALTYMQTGVGSPP
jgi:hypothetical protein